MTAAETKGGGDTAVSADKVNSAVGALVAACETAARVTSQGYYREAVHDQLAREALACVLRQATVLERLIAPLGVGSADVDGPVRLVSYWDGFLRQARERKRDAAADKEQAIAVLHAEEDRGELADVRAGLGSQAIEAVGVADADALPPVVDLGHHKNSSAVGAPGAENTGSLASTVEAPADSPSSSAGRGVGGGRPRRLIARLRGRSSP